MIRLSWRQFRVQALVSAAVLTLVAIVLAVTGPHLAHLYDTTVATCRAHGDCGTATNAFVTNDHLLQAALNSLVLILPALIAIFWGAPLIARELETGTFRLAWTQSVTRSRWLAVKLGLAGLASIAVAGLLSLMVSWWSSPFDRANLNRFTPAVFGERGLTPVGYAAAAFALGVTTGVLIRRTLPAMAAALAAFTGARIAMVFWVRPNLQVPVRASSALQVNAGNGPLVVGGTATPGWVLSAGQTINAAGHVIGQNGGIGPNGSIGFYVHGAALIFAGVGRCPNRIPGVSRAARGGRPAQVKVQAAMQACADRLHIRELVTYQPASRYWPFQWYELAIFLGLALALAGLCFWWVRRRLS